MIQSAVQARDRGQAGGRSGRRREMLNLRAAQEEFQGGFCGKFNFNRSFLFFVRTQDFTASCQEPEIILNRIYLDSGFEIDIRGECNNLQDDSNP